MATQRAPSNRLAMLLSVLIPGAGQFYLDHYLKAAAVFAVAVTAANGIFLGATLRSLPNTEVLGWGAGVVLAVTWLWSIGHTYRQSYGTDRARLAAERKLLLRQALVDYLRDDLDDAARKLERAVAADVDWQDPDPLFHLGVVMLRLAERKATRGDADGARTARRRSQWAFRTCLQRDATEKWKVEIGLESKRMRRLLSFRGRLRRSGSQELAFPELQATGTLDMAALRKIRDLRSSSVMKRMQSARLDKDKVRAALARDGGEAEPEPEPEQRPAAAPAPAGPPPTRQVTRPELETEARQETAPAVGPPPTRQITRREPTREAEGRHLPDTQRSTRVEQRDLPETRREVRVEERELPETRRELRTPGSESETRGPNPESESESETESESESESETRGPSPESENRGPSPETESETESTLRGSASPRAKPPRKASQVGEDNTVAPAETAGRPPAATEDSSKDARSSEPATQSLPTGEAN